MVAFMSLLAISSFGLSFIYLVIDQETGNILHEVALLQSVTILHSESHDSSLSRIKHIESVTTILC